ncbi:molybdate ABC transporter substrate-binding protein [soil metagenome]
MAHRAFRPLSSWPRLALLALVAAFPLLTGGCPGSPSDQDGRLLIFAASDLQPVLPEIAEAYQTATGHEVLLVFGSSGNLARQIEHGAPADLYLSANEQFVDDLVARGVLDGGSRTVYAVGWLALIGAAGVSPPRSLEDLRDARFTTIAIANPEHAPYGTASREALTSAGVWTEVASRLVFADNVVQAHQLVRSGSAEAGMVALSLAIASGDPQPIVVEGWLHRPLHQTGGAVAGSPRLDVARDFLSYLRGPAGQQAMARFGFGSPEEG